jgi:hypothetical protein
MLSLLQNSIRPSPPAYGGIFDSPSPQREEGTNTFPINMSPIRITIKVVAFLVFGGWFNRLTIKRTVDCH